MSCSTRIRPLSIPVFRKEIEDREYIASMARRLLANRMRPAPGHLKPARASENYRKAGETADEEPFLKRAFTMLRHLSPLFVGATALAGGKMQKAPGGTLKKAPSGGTTTPPPSTSVIRTPSDGPRTSWSFLLARRSA